MVCNLLHRNCWSSVFWRKWDHSDHEFRTVCEHVGGIFSPMNWWIGPQGYLFSTGRSNGLHFKGIDNCFEGTLSVAPHFIKGRFGVTSPFPRFAMASPCDFYLWGYLKSRVYVNRPRSLQDLKTNIREEIANIPADTLMRFIANTRNRFIQCVDNGGCHLPDMIFKIVRQNFKYVLSLWNKNETYMICKTCFIAFWKKEVMLPHPV